MQRSGIQDERSLRSLDSATLHRGYSLQRNWLTGWRKATRTGIGVHWRSSYAPLEVLPLAGNAIWRYGILRASLEQRGLPIGSLDTLIAAHALALNVTLVTNNAAEFSRVDGLRLENWV